MVTDKLIVHPIGKLVVVIFDRYLARNNLS